MLEPFRSKISQALKRARSEGHWLWSGWRKRPVQTLRTKLVVSFSLLALMAGLCGIVGLMFVNRIAGAVSELSGTTTPLLFESRSLIENAHNMRALVSPPGVSDLDAQLGKLANLKDEGHSYDENIQQLVDRGGFEIDFGSVVGLQEEFAETIETMIIARARQADIDAKIARRAAAVDAARTEGERILERISRAADIAIVEAEEEAKVQIQTGRATAEEIGKIFSFAATEVEPTLQNANKLLRTSTRLQDLTQAALAAGDASALAPIQSEIDETFKVGASVLDKLSTRMGAPDEQASYEALLDASKTLKSAMIGADGLLRAKWSLVNAEAQIESGSAKLDQIDQRYFQLLSELESAVRARNDTSEQRTAGIISEGWEVISAAVALTALLAIGAALFLAVAILRPLTRLTEKVAAVRKSGELSPMTDSRLLAQADELGELARSFDKMLVELSEARRQRIASSEQEIAKQVLLLKTALANMSQGLCMFDRDGRLIVANDQYAKTYGLSPECVRPGMSIQDVVQQRVIAGSHYADATVEQNFKGALAAKPSQMVVELRNGRVVRIHRQPMAGGGFVATHEDITERRRTEEKIAHMAHHDALTNLPNRALFHDRLKETLKQCHQGGSIAVLCLDLDHFKGINDTLGHPIGDALLRAVTLRLLGAVRDTDTLSRFGGDEFAIIQHIRKNANEAEALAARIIEKISAPFDLDGNQVVIGISIGIAFYPQDGQTADELVKHADLALYRAKAEGRGIFRAFEIEMDLSMQARRKLELELRSAITHEQFELFYQPLFDLRRNEIKSFEALARWHHPKRGLVAPDEFIPVAEETGLIVPLGKWILQRACRDAAQWPEQVRVAVNLSPIQFKSPGLFETVVGALKSGGLAAGRLDLEITESTLLYETDLALATLHRLKELGVRIVMDDFGTGYSSLSYLRKFPFDKIKIDSSFIRDLATSEEALAIVRAVTGLSSSFGIASTAEGVETAQQLEKARAEGCTEVQGFLISPPRPANELHTLFENPAELRKLVGRLRHMHDTSPPAKSA